jgi:hypothetical protein
LCFQEIVSEEALAHHKAGIEFFLEFFRLDIQHVAVTVALFRPKTDHPKMIASQLAGTVTASFSDAIGATELRALTACT